MTKWVFIDETNGAQTQSGESLTPQSLQRIADACEIQNTLHYVPECGGQPITCRVGTVADIQPDERVYTFRPDLPEAPGAEAYHDINGVGVPFAVEGITLCSSLFGAGGASVGASHEVCETQGDEGANLWADDRNGRQVARERCDAFEMQSYPITVNGEQTFVSNFALDSFFIPNASAPYNYMSLMGLDGAVEAPGPMQTAPGQGGNYQIVQSSPTDTTTVQAMMTPRHPRILGTPKRLDKVRHWSSRAARRGIMIAGVLLALMGCQRPANSPDGGSDAGGVTVQQVLTTENQICIASEVADTFLAPNTIVSDVLKVCNIAPALTQDVLNFISLFQAKHGAKLASMRRDAGK